ncbi:Protein export [Halorhabdus tiamatea SARL4B]|uniref:Sec-independent protein translocase protein TatC n=1 Tax=Halorhabdus tiamatea SARL4B TaxID=1033806 RepID=F7PJ60_9EURY|nr:twin-arginine translocase subunit TatC [Halorhabdus tiamatea]ERJ06836.1 Protein export [Halorhabdus tiamatea SARL4B]CCQ33027.1 twin-arginine translocation protein TatC [Halorhabdus tiamatea SARL4B]
MTDGDGPDDTDDRSGNGHDADPARDDAVDEPDPADPARDDAVDESDPTGESDVDSDPSDARDVGDSADEETGKDTTTTDVPDTEPALADHWEPEDAGESADDEGSSTEEEPTEDTDAQDADHAGHARDARARGKASTDSDGDVDPMEPTRTADEPPDQEPPRETFETDPTETAADKAPDDEEMPLSDHIEEMVRRLGVVLVLMAGVSAVVFPFGEQIINTIWYSFLPGTLEQCPTTGTVVTEAGATIKPACPRVYNPLATILARFKVATLAGFVVALPAFVYETYLFMRPGLFPRERRYYLAAVPTSLVLATVGLAFAYILVLPAIFTYFLYYSEGAADIAFGLTQTFDLMVLMMGFFAAIFQIPLFIMLAIMMGVTSREWLADRRLLFWAAFAGVAFIFNPDPTGMAPFIVAATMIALFEGTLLLLSWTGSDGLLPSPNAVAARRPYAWVLAAVAGYLASDAPLPAGYYEQLPAVVSGVIESNGLLGMTPIVVGGALIAAYELVVILLARYLPMGGLKQTLFTGRLSLRRLRPPVWLLSIVVGYFASPEPFLLDRANEIALAPVEAGGLAVGLIVAFEVALAVWRFVRPAEGDRLPLKR